MEDKKNDLIKISLGYLLHLIIDLTAMFFVSRFDGMTEIEKVFVIGIFAVALIIVTGIFIFQMKSIRENRESRSGMRD